MSSIPVTELLVDPAGERYFVAELAAFKIFGTRYLEIVRASRDAIYQDPRLDQKLAEAKRRDQEKLDQLQLGRTGNLLSRLIGWLLRALLGGMANVQEHTPSQPSQPAREPELPHGQFKIFVGKRTRITDNQRALFDWLTSTQQDTAEQVRKGIYTYYQRVYPDYKESLGDSPSTLIDLPEIVRGDEINDNVRLTSVVLHPTQRTIGLTFDCTWEEEHGLGVLIENQQVVDVGEADVALVN